MTIDLLFALPVKAQRCNRNPKRLILVSATGEVLLRTLADTMRDQDIAERFVLAMNEWAAAEQRRLVPLRYGINKSLEIEA
jgi:hypothetical protein